MSESKKEKLWILVLWTILGGVLVSLYYYSAYSHFDKDEIEHIHTAWKMLQGQEIYVDFFQHHHPFFHYLLIPVIDFVGANINSILAVRNVMFFMTILILVVTYLLSQCIFENFELSIISIILTSTVSTFYMASIEIRPDVPQALAGLVSIYFLFSYYRNKSLLSLLLSSVFLALSFLFLQKSLVLISAIGVIFIYDLFKKNLTLKHLSYYVVVFLMCISPYYIYLFINGSIEQYFTMNWLVNLYLPQYHPKIQYIQLALKENTLTLILYIIGLYTLLKSGLERRFVFLSLLLLILPIMFLKNIWKQYFILAIPLIGIIASYPIYTLFRKRWVRLVILISALYIPMSIMHNHNFFKMEQNRQAKQIDRINYVLSITDENDKVYDREIVFNVFRDDIDYFWFCANCLVAFNNIKGYQLDIYDSIERHKPKVIAKNLINYNDRRIKPYYEISDKYPDLLIRRD